MSCYHPLLRVPSHLKYDGDVDYKVIPFDEKLLNKVYKFRNYFTDEDIEAKAMLVGCGQCIGCRLQKSATWAARCMLEMPYHRKTYFVTLTYDDFHLENGIKLQGKVSDIPLRYYTDPSTGEAFPSYSVSKETWKKFMKRLRRNFPDLHLRYFACGEYGTKSQRPHYHAIMFGLELDDLVPYKRNDLGQWLYNSASFQEAWTDEFGPIGYAVLADVSFETCAYVARYTMKKQTGKNAKVYETFNIEPEFALMSRKPGIAYQYLLDHPEIYDFDQINISTLKGGVKIKPPAYYDRLFDDINPVRMKEVKENRRNVAEAVTAAKMANTNLSYLEMLAVEEENRKSKVKVLRRKEI